MAAIGAKICYHREGAFYQLPMLLPRRNKFLASMISVSTLSLGPKPRCAELSWWIHQKETSDPTASLNPASGDMADSVGTSGKALPTLPMSKPGTASAAQQAKRSAIAGLASHPLGDLAEDEGGDGESWRPAARQIGTESASKDITWVTIKPDRCVPP